MTDDVKIPFKRETWPEDADGDLPTLCTVCGTPVRYGSRHSRCGEVPFTGSPVIEDTLRAPDDAIPPEPWRNLAEKLIEAAIDSDASGRPDGALYQLAIDLRRAIAASIPPERKPLTDARVAEIVDDAWNRAEFDTAVCGSPESEWSRYGELVARFIEAEHGIGEVSK